MAKRTRTRRRSSGRFTARRPAAIVVAAPRRAPARRRAAPRLVRRRVAVGGSSGGVSRLVRKGAIALAVGFAEREGYLARVPEIGQLGAIGSAGAIAWALRRFGRVNLPILDDVTEIAVITMGLKLGREGLTGSSRVSGTDIGATDIGAESDPFEVQGDDGDDF